MIWGVEEEDIAAAERERREEEEERGRRRWLGGECLVGENARDNGEENSGRALTHIISLLSFGFGVLWSETFVSIASVS